jgi:hypothetical protein
VNKMQLKARQNGHTPVDVKRGQNVRAERMREKLFMGKTVCVCVCGEGEGRLDIQKA